MAAHGTELRSSPQVNSFTMSRLINDRSLRLGGLKQVYLSEKHKLVIVS